MRPVGMALLMAACSCRQSGRNFSALPPWEWKEKNAIALNLTATIVRVTVGYRQPRFQNHGWGEILAP